MKTNTWEQAAMAFVLDNVINEIEETRSLEPLKKFKKTLLKSLPITE